MSLDHLIHNVWFLGLFLQALLTAVLLIKRKWRTFPIFTSYTAFSLLESLVAWAVYKNQTLYLITYVVGESVLMILGLALVREIFIHLFSAHAALRKVATLLFRIVVVLLIVLAVAVICAKVPMSSVFGSTLLIVESADWIVQVGLLMLVLLFVMAFGLLFSADARLRKGATVFFRIAAMVAMILGVAVILAKSPMGSLRIVLGSVLWIVEEACRIVLVGLIMLLFLFSSAFGLRWRQHVFGVALGLGMTTVGSLLAVTMVPHVNKAVAVALNLTHVVTFDVALLVWMGYLIAPEPVRSSADVPKRAQLEQWNQAVMDLISR